MEQPRSLTYHVYAGFSYGLNRASNDSKYNQLYLIKFGFTKIYYRNEKDALAQWLDRFNNGFANHKLCNGRWELEKDSRGKIIRKSPPLALFSDWERIAYEDVGTYDKAVHGIEAPLKKWAQQRFEVFAMHDQIEIEMNKYRDLYIGNVEGFGNNGIGEIFCIKPNQINNLDDIWQKSNINDPLADSLIAQLIKFTKEELRTFVSSINFSRS